jgi:hypothetical protein
MFDPKQPIIFSPKDNVVPDETLALLMTILELSHAQGVPSLHFAEERYKYWTLQIEDYRQS